MKIPFAEIPASKCRGPELASVIFLKTMKWSRRQLLSLINELLFGNITVGERVRQYGIGPDDFCCK